VIDKELLKITSGDTRRQFYSLIFLAAGKDLLLVLDQLHFLFKRGNIYQPTSLIDEDITPAVPTGRHTKFYVVSFLFLSYSSLHNEYQVLLFLWLEPARREALNRFSPVLKFLLKLEYFLNTSN
jgi:hypothetical protein